MVEQSNLALEAEPGERSRRSPSRLIEGRHLAGLLLALENSPRVVGICFSALGPRRPWR